MLPRSARIDECALARAAERGYDVTARNHGRFTAVCKPGVSEGCVDDETTPLRHSLSADYVGGDFVYMLRNVGE